MIAVAFLLNFLPQRLHPVRKRPCVDSEKLNILRGGTREAAHLVRQAVSEGRRAYGWSTIALREMPC